MKIPDATTISRTCLPASMKDVSMCETYKKGPYVIPDLRRGHTVYPNKTREYSLFCLICLRPIIYLSVIKGRVFLG